MADRKVVISVLQVDTPDAVQKRAKEFDVPTLLQYLKLALPINLRDGCVATVWVGTTPASLLHEAKAAYEAQGWSVDLDRAFYMTFRKAQ